MNARDPRKYWNYGKPAGKVSLPRPLSVAQTPQLLFPLPRTLQQLPSRRRWGSLA
jgi:hypothetical protein